MRTALSCLTLHEPRTLVTALKLMRSAGPLVPIVVGQAVLQIIMPLSPLPGGAGVAEIGYLGLMGRSIPQDLTVASLVVWRVYTWVIPMALGGLVLAIRTATRRRPRNATRGPQSCGESED